MIMRLIKIDIKSQLGVLNILSVRVILEELCIFMGVIVYWFIGN